MIATRGLILILIILSTLLPATANAQANFSECQIRVLNSSNLQTFDIHGNLLSDQTGGLKYAQCVEICGDGWQRNDWAAISAGLTAWLFPWLVLVAQLPFQTEGAVNDIFSAILAIGSPVIAMYSMFITLRNSRWIYSKCDEDGIERRYRNKNHLRSVAVVLLSCQQVPLAVNNLAYLACSITLHGNERWWQELAERLKTTARTMPDSLWPQMAVVIGTYILVIIDSFRLVGGSPTFSID